jgi:5-hydroxyisourate hydrolase-like protein (transthyretin family)
MNQVIDKVKGSSLIVKGVIALVVLILFMWLNPWSYNDPTERTVVTGQFGGQKVVFEGGVYFAGLFAKEQPYPNRMSVVYNGTVVSESMDAEKTFNIGNVEVRFNDATTAKLTGIVQYRLPSTEKDMLEIHNTHGTPEALVKRRLAPYTQECLQSAAQLLSAEVCYSGGRAQMTQDYLDQLKNGSYLLYVKTNDVYDSLERAVKRIYEVKIQLDANKQKARKFSSIKEYDVSIDDAQITDVDYQQQVDNMLTKKIEASTAASVAKQQLMTALQQAETAKAKGQQKLVETEYAKKVEQTNQVVAAQTKVQLAEQYKLEQKMAAEAALFAAQVVKTDADAAAYAASRMVSAGLSPIDKAEYEMKTKIGVATALSKVVLPTTYISGGQNGNTNSLIDALLSSKLIEK